MVTKRNATTNNDGSISDRSPSPEDKDPLLQTETEQMVLKGRGRPRKIQKPASPMEDSSIENRLSSMEGSIKSLVDVMKTGMDNLVGIVKQQQQLQPYPTNPRSYFQTVDPCMGDVREASKANKYEDLYADSQKKMAQLENENVELKKKLSSVSATIDGYEKGQHMFAEAFGNFKDAYLISCLTKNADIVPGQPPENTTSVPEPGPKRRGKKMAQPAPASSPAPPRYNARRSKKKVVECERPPAPTKRKISGDDEV